MRLHCMHCHLAACLQRFASGSWTCNAKQAKIVADRWASLHSNSTYYTKQQTCAEDHLRHTKVVHVAHNTIQSIQLGQSQTDHHKGQKAHLAEVPVQNGTEDARHARVVHLCHTHLVEVAGESGRDEAAAAAGRAHRGDKLGVDDAAKCVSALVPARLQKQL